MGEELGLIGCIVVLALFALFAVGAFHVIRKTDDPFIRIVVRWRSRSGSSARRSSTSASCCGVFPVLGVPLPFMSQGGTSLLSVLVACGVLLSFARTLPGGRPSRPARRGIRGARASRARVRVATVTTYLLAGGGTAGHVNPLLAVADGLRARDPEAPVLVLGTREGLEARLVPERGYELLIVDKVPFPRRPERGGRGFPGALPACDRPGARAHPRARRRCRRRLRRLRLRARPTSRRARAGVPFVVHEANAQARDWRTCSAPAARPRSASPSTGTPLRGGARRRHAAAPRDRRPRSRGRSATRRPQHFGLDAARPTLLVFGGSLGAQRLNEAFGGSWQDVLDGRLAARCT